MNQTFETEQTEFIVTRDGELDPQWQRKQRIDHITGVLGHTGLIILKAPFMAAVALQEAFEHDFGGTIEAGD